MAIALLRLVFGPLMILFVVSCGVDRKIEPVSTPVAATAPDADRAQELTQEVADFLESKPDYLYPELTFIIEVKDVPTAVAKIEEVKGRVLYDPNFGEGSAIPFLVVNLPADKYLDDEWITSLGFVGGSLSRQNFRPLQSGSAPLPKTGGADHLPSPGEGRAVSSTGSVVFVPTADIQIPELRARVPGRGLGEGIVVAVVDTGIDASHPVFQDRVIFWNDATQEGRHLISVVSLKEGRFSLSVLGKEKSFELPEALKSATKVYAGVIAEKAMTAQVGFDERLAGAEGTDLNKNQKTDDEFLVVLAPREGAEKEFVAYVDVSGNGKWEANELSQSIIDFNDWRNGERFRGQPDVTGFVKFPARNRKREYAFLVEKNAVGEPEAITLGFDFNDHGTHVAGIVGGKSAQVEGAAPEAKFMSLKVCSGISCTDASIVRGLISAFYNPYGLVPDVVNISLGSNQEYRFHILDRVIADLSAKFGTTFVISASNDGPGYRSINGLGSGAPTIHVGAHVSRKTRMSHYHLDPSVKTEDHHLLFFSSAGPSFTGELRPNVVAPGSALSSTSLVNDRSSMFNGTSMSAPITAGAVAALLSLMKEEPSWKTWLSIRDAKIKSLKERAPIAGSLTPMPLAIRTALENSALRLPNLTMAQQGYGLVQISQAYDALKALSERVMAKEADFFELTINGDAKSGRLFNRQEFPAPIRGISVDVRADGERTDEELMAIRNGPMSVKIARVEIQAPNGKVQTLKDGFPYALGSPGASGQNLRESILHSPVLSKAQVIALRRLEVMKEGYTYLAVLEVERNGVRVGTIVDLIQRDYGLSSTPTEFHLPGIQATREVKTFACGFKEVSLDPLEFHRYPVRVTHEDSSLNVRAGLSLGKEGAAWVYVYDPDGYPVAEELLLFSKEFPSRSPLVNIQVPTWKKKGIYEVTIAAGHRTVMGPTQYDLMISTTRFAAFPRRVDLRTKAAKSLTSLEPFATSSILSSGVTDPVASASLGPVLGAQYIPDFKVIPQRMTYRALKLPKEIAVTDVVISRGPTLEEAGSGDYFMGRIDHRLYGLDEQNQPVVIATANPKASTTSKVIFEGVKFQPNKTLYMAVETFYLDRSYPDQDQRPKFSEIDIQIVFPNLILSPQSLDPQASEQKASPLKARWKGLESMSQVTILAPETFGVASEKARVVGATVLTVTSKTGQRLEIPVRFWE